MDSPASASPRRQIRALPPPCDQPTTNPSSPATQCQAVTDLSSRATPCPADDGSELSRHPAPIRRRVRALLPTPTMVPSILGLIQRPRFVQARDPERVRLLLLLELSSPLRTWATPSHGPESKTSSPMRSFRQHHRLFDGRHAVHPFPWRPSGHHEPATPYMVQFLCVDVELISPVQFAVRIWGSFLRASARSALCGCVLHLAFWSGSLVSQCISDGCAMRLVFLY